MTTWLDPLRRALDTAPAPVSIFFRDDDGGWADDALFALLDLFASYTLPLDVAVIPQALTSSLAQELRTRVARTPALVRLHQHGFAHTNHESTGRKCEFGPARLKADQQRDIEWGRRQLHELLGPTVDPIFTPPWNRCTTETGECLRTLGFRLLSRDATAVPLAIAGLGELPISVDWFAQRKGARLPREEFGVLLAATVTPAKPLGIMFHHAMMDAEEHAAANDLLAVLATHPQVACRSMRALTDTASEPRH